MFYLGYNPQKGKKINPQAIIFKQMALKRQMEINAYRKYILDNLKIQKKTNFNNELNNYNNSFKKNNEEIKISNLEGIKSNSNPEDSKLEDSKLEYSNPEDSKLEDSKLEESNLEESNLEDLKLEESNSEDSKLEDSKLEDSKLDDSKLEESNLEESNSEDSNSNSVNEIQYPIIEISNENQEININIFSNILKETLDAESEEQINEINMEEETENLIQDDIQQEYDLPDEDQIVEFKEIYDINEKN